MTKHAAEMPAIERAARAAKDAAALVGELSTAVKDALLLDLAERIEANAAEILRANELDMQRAREADLGEAKLRRLELTEGSIAQLADGLRQIAVLPDPVGLVTRDDEMPSGLRVRKMRSPLGVIAMIYEARPAVTIDAFALCFKAGNACLLKGGREAAESNLCLERLAHAALRDAGLPESALTLVTTSDREEIKHMLSLAGVIDLVIPRGGTTLIEFVHEHARVPTVQHFHGVCHAYVDGSADLESATEICITAKSKAPATCNALECVLVDRSVAERFVPMLFEACEREQVELRGDADVIEIVPEAVSANEDDWGTEYLDFILAVRVVDGVDGAIEHIRRHGSDHTECVIASDASVQDAFIRRVTSSCVVVNASTRFNDGYQLGLGAEIGISTSRIHAYGPMGLEELTTQRFVVTGSGQTR